jgi:hypothetical protein
MQNNSSTIEPINHARLSAQGQRMIRVYPREFLRGWENAQDETLFAYVGDGVSHHGLHGEAEQAYRDGWAEFVLRRPIQDERAANGGYLPSTREEMMA